MTHCSIISCIVQFAGKEECRMWLLFAAASALFAGGDKYSGEMWNPENRFHSSDSSADSSHPGIFLDHGMDRRIGKQVTSVSGKTLLFLILSGAATGASWLCYFRALQTRN